MSEESHHFANRLAKAEGWLSSVADHIETALDMALDQEALVYLRSRGHACHDQVTALIASWKKAEKASLDEHNIDMVAMARQSGKNGKEQKPEANVTNVAEIDPIFPRDFWGTAPL